MKFANTNDVWFYDDGGAFAKQVDAILQTKWKQAVEAGDLITSTMANQIHKEAVKQATREYEAEHRNRVPL